MPIRTVQVDSAYARAVANSSRPIFWLCSIPRSAWCRTATLTTVRIAHGLRRVGHFPIMRILSESPNPIERPLRSSSTSVANGNNGRFPEVRLLLVVSYVRCCAQGIHLRWCGSRWFRSDRNGQRMSVSEVAGPRNHFYYNSIECEI